MKLKYAIEQLQEIEKRHGGDVEVLLNNEVAPQDVTGDTEKFFIVPEERKSDLGLSEMTVSLRAWPY